MARNASGATIQARVSGELYSRLEAMGEETGATQSEVVRTLLETALGTPAKEAALKEAMWAIHSKLRNAMHAIGPEIAELLRVQVAAELDEK